METDDGPGLRLSVTHELAVMLADAGKAPQGQSPGGRPAAPGIEGDDGAADPTEPGDDEAS